MSEGGLKTGVTEKVRTGDDSSVMSLTAALLVSSADETTDLLLLLDSFGL